MAQTTIPIAIRISDVLSGTLEVLRRYFLEFLLFGILLFAPFLGAIEILGISYEVVFDTESSGYWIFGFAVPTILMSLLTIPLTHASLAVFSGQPLPFWQAVRECPRFIGSAITVSIISTILVVAGLILLVVPGLVLMTYLAVTVPAVIREDMGPFAAIRRSVQMVRGNAWRVFAITLLYFVPSLFVESSLPEEMSPFLYVCALFFFDIILILVSAPMTAAMYYALAIAHEGQTENELETIFE